MRMKFNIFMSFLFFKTIVSYNISESNHIPLSASDYIPLSEDEGYFISYKNNVRKDDPVRNYLK